MRTRTRRLQKCCFNSLLSTRTTTRTTTTTTTTTTLLLNKQTNKQYVLCSFQSINQKSINRIVQRVKFKREEGKKKNSSRVQNLSEKKRSTASKSFKTFSFSNWWLDVVERKTRRPSIGEYQQTYHHVFNKSTIFFPSSISSAILSIFSLSLFFSLSF